METTPLIETIPAKAHIEYTVRCINGDTGEEKWCETVTMEAPEPESEPMPTWAGWLLTLIGALSIIGASLLFYGFTYWLGSMLGLVGLVFTAGHNLVLDYTFKTGSGGTPAWYVGLKGTGTLATGDTMASHAGWTETTAYSNGTRPAWTPGSISAGAVDNSGSVATFNMNAAYTAAGFFLTTNSTKGGTTGTAYGGVDFGTSRTGDSPDVITVQANLAQS